MYESEKSIFPVVIAKHIAVIFIINIFISIMVSVISSFLMLDGFESYIVAVIGAVCFLVFNFIMSRGLFIQMDDGIGFYIGTVIYYLAFASVNYFVLIFCTEKMYRWFFGISHCFKIFNTGMPDALATSLYLLLLLAIILIAPIPFEMLFFREE